ncbi:rims-binding protein 2 isoform x3 [Limosa lapponica baueri]|uniref:Rims-binding protein 2 isoform x3 n=1 Tax=Limosa lapponica baueri TaxID=1758121 RepID=A0A2I0TEH2_LIMLA|nr:rims-binding protein 2 isoform x3 [Limosa lapponica baueri]
MFMDMAMFVETQEKAIGRIQDHGCSVLDSSKANQSISKVDKPLTKEQEEDKVSKKGNRKAKQTSEKPPHRRAEGRSKQKSSSITIKKSKVSVICLKIFQWPYYQLLKQLSRH